MKRILFITLVAIMAFSTIPGYAQFGNLKKAVKEKAKKEEPKTNNTTEKNTSETVVKSDSNTENPNQSNKQITFDSKYPPGMLFSSLLDGMILHENGKLAFMDIRATFLPPAKGTKVQENYNEVDGGKLEAVIKSGDGKVSERKYWRGVPLQNPFWKIFPAYSGFIEMSPGDYTLEFLVEGNPFYRFPFSVVNEKGGDDPFAPGAKDKLTIKGAWEKYGYLHLDNNNPETQLQFKTWLRSPVKKDSAMKLELYRDGKVIAQDTGNSLTLPVKWETRPFSFTKPGGAMFLGSDLFGKDGNYKVVLRLGGSVYGEYPFTIKGGNFVYLPEQTRGEADPMTMIEGGNNSWYVKREN